MADKTNWQPKAEYGERQYRRVDTRLWNDRRFRSFTATGRTVWLFLLTNPRTTSIPGLFPLHEEEAARMCGLSVEGFREGFAQPFREGMVEADWGAGLVWLKKAARYEPPTGPNVVAAWRKVARMALPECPLLWRALTGIREQLREVMATPEPFLDAFAKAFPEPFMDGFPEPFSPTDDGRRKTEDGVSPTERTASPTAAVAASPTVDDLPDATGDAQPVDERPSLVLEAQSAEKSPRRPSAGEALYFRMEDRRQKACVKAGKPFIPSGWSNSRMNRDLGPIARAEKGNPEAWRRFQGAWLEFITDEAPGNAADPWPLDWFWAQRAKYEARAAHAEEAA